ncbi:ribosome modulation factor [Acidisoma silvae]|uniref:ribosome modulation factor n=1 Tax=Acidisoma silvae TaxID=2802396 RepID=UPI003873A436
MASRVVPIGPAKVRRSHYLRSSCWLTRFSEPIYPCGGPFLTSASGCLKIDSLASASIPTCLMKRMDVGTMNDSSVADLRVRTEGRSAREAGQPVTACPYPADTPLNYQWTSGWMQPSPTAPEDAS